MRHTFVSFIFLLVDVALNFLFYSKTPKNLFVIEKAFLKRDSKQRIKLGPYYN